LNEGGVDASVRAQAGRALIALAEVAAAAWRDPQFVRRQRHGDPTAMPELRARACARVSANPAAVEALLRQDAALRALWDQTVEQARATAAEGASRARNLLLMAIGAVALCAISWLAFTYYQGQVAARHPAGRAAPASP
jgi:hypothetical protein